MPIPQPEIAQIAFIVTDLISACEQWQKEFGVGPFYVADEFRMLEPIYQGEPTDISISIAMTYTGGFWLELIQQLNDVPSVYREVLGDTGPGLHHFAVITNDYDKTVETYEQKGCPSAFSANVPVGRTSQFSYFRLIEGPVRFVEIIENNESVNNIFDGIRRASISGTGGEAIRDFSTLLS